MKQRKSTLSAEDKKNFTEYVNKIKFIGGFGDYRIDLDVAKKDDPDSRAVVIADEDDKVVLIRLYKNFFALEPWQQRSDLVHEIVHGRIGQAQELTKAMIGKIEYKNEEAAVNDFTRAFDQLLAERERLQKEVDDLRAIVEKLHDQKPTADRSSS